MYGNDGALADAFVQRIVRGQTGGDVENVQEGVQLDIVRQPGTDGVGCPLSGPVVFGMAEEHSDGLHLAAEVEVVVGGGAQEACGGVGGLADEAADLGRTIAWPFVPAQRLGAEACGQRTWRRRHGDGDQPTKLWRPAGGWVGAVCGKVVDVLRPSGVGFNLPVDQGDHGMDRRGVEYERRRGARGRRRGGPFEHGETVRFFDGETVSGEVVREAARRGGGRA